MRQHLEPQRAGERRGFQKLPLRSSPSRKVSPLREPTRRACFFEPEIIGAEAAGRDEAVGGGLGELDEQPGLGDAGDPRLEGRADARGEWAAISRSAFRVRPPWRAAGAGNAFGDVGEPAARPPPIRPARVQRADQRAMDDEFRIAADSAR